jgi:hypothetical protein
MKKLEHPISHSEMFDFSSFRAKVRKKLKKKALKDIKVSRYKKIKQEGEVAKIGLSGFGYQSIRFF